MWGNTVSGGNSICRKWDNETTPFSSFHIAFWLASPLKRSYFVMGSCIPDAHTHTYSTEQNNDPEINSLIHMSWRQCEDWLRWNGVGWSDGSSIEAAPDGWDPIIRWRMHWRRDETRCCSHSYIKAGWGMGIPIIPLMRETRTGGKRWDTHIANPQPEEMRFSPSTSCFSILFANFKATAIIESLGSTLYLWLASG